MCGLRSHADNISMTFAENTYLSPYSNPQPPAATEADLSEGQPEACAPVRVVIGHELRRSKLN